MPDDSAPTGRILALSADDHWMQAGFPSELVARGQGRPTLSGWSFPSDAELDFYDETGHRLHPLLRSDLRLRGFIASDPAVPDEMADRIGRVLEWVTSRADDDDARARLRHLSELLDQGRLPALLSEVSAASTEPGETARGKHEGGWLYKLWRTIFG
ncbi:MAG: hypothetical protein QM708_08605 [Propioniciclava sp.]|uniref:hypothetical protein n=1 Tax=Propioniciclava sp. TaxID=2038686 RepID=UPI0039E5A4A1